MNPVVTYDPRVQVYSVELADLPIAKTAELDDSHLVDLADDGSVVAIEILTPDNPRIEDMAARFGFEDRVPAILAAVRAVFGQ